MNRTNPILRVIVLFLVGLALLQPNHVVAANMRTFIESVRRKAVVVYVGTVKEARILERTKFDLKARAVVSISAVVRGPESRPAEATFEYSSYDEKTPMLAGGPQYQLQPGTRVVIFADSFSSANRPAYLIQGDRAELRQRVEALRDSLRKLSAEQLKLQEINEEDRQVQLTLYEKLIAAL